MKVRQDAWSYEEDLLLAETVLNYIRNGKTQLSAFNEAAHRLSRTAAACGFRWNAEVRKKHEDAVSLAKKEWKERKRALEKAKKGIASSNHALSSFTVFSSIEHKTKENDINDLPAFIENITLNDVIHFLSHLQSNQIDMELTRTENYRLKAENDRLAKRQKELEDSLARLQTRHAIIQEDHDILLQIINRARDLFIQEGSKQPFHSFDNINGTSDLHQLSNS